jgi:putative transposase
MLIFWVQPGASGGGLEDPSMKRSRFTPEQITMALRQVEAGTPVAEICRSLEITEATFYRWKKKYGSLGTPEIR